MTTLTIALSRVQQPQDIGMKLPPGVFRASELMPNVLARYGLSLESECEAARPALASEANDYFDVVIAGLESALAS